MKISAKKYAQALFLSVKDKEKKEVSEIIDNFVKLLAEHHQLALSRKILYFLENFYQKEGLVCPVSIETAHRLSKENKDEILNFLENQTKGAEIEWRESVNSEILGGFILRYRDKIYDASLKNRLNQFNKEINKK